jgi:ABC-2 type transport system permease protein
MKELLKIEWLKLKNYTVFKVLGILFLAGVLLSNFIGYKLVQNINDNVNAPGFTGIFRPYSFYYVWQTASWVSGLLLVLPAMLLIILITNEYTYRTNRQNIIDGWSRKQFIEVKIVMGLIFALLSTLMVIITAMIFGLVTGEGFSMHNFSYVFYFLLKAVSYNMVAILFSVLLRRTGFAIGLFFIYMGAENLIATLLDFWSIYLRQIDKLDLGSMGDYLPMNASDGLLSFPDNPFKPIAKSAMPTDFTTLVFSLAVAYLLLFVWWSRRKVIRADL